MIQVNDVTLRFGKRTLFENVNLKFTDGNCYGIIGANGAGKSTFLKVLSKEIDTTKGDIIIGKNERIAVLKQDHYQYDSYKVIDTVIMGNTKLYDIMQKKEKLYSKEDFTDADGIELGNLEAVFLDLNGWEADNDAKVLLNNLGIDNMYHDLLMKDVPSNIKVKVLLAQALFGNPDILLLDEPTNNLDIDAINWLEEFIINYLNTVIVVSHDRHFLNKVCTHIVDIDYSRMRMYLGNYDFWYESSQLLLNQMKEQNKKKEAKIKELQEFIARFSANASKSKQATSRKKILEKIELDTLEPSSRKYPFIDFKTEKPSGKDILKIKNLTYIEDGKKVLDDISFIVSKNDKIAFVGSNNIAKTVLFEIIAGNLTPNSGEISIGTTITTSYFPQDNAQYFKNDLPLLEWMSSNSNEKDETILRSFLGRMLFSGEEVFKKVSVLSGGEKARCMFSKCMLECPNFLILDEPTNHLDLESITSLNNALIKFTGEILFSSHDQQLTDTITNRVIEILPNGKIIDKKGSYEAYLEFKKKNV